MSAEKTSLQIGQFFVTVLENIGQRTDRIRYFKVRCDKEDGSDSKEGLLRVGSVTGSLQRELELRDILGDYALVAPLLGQTTASHSHMAEILPESPPLNDNVVETLTEEKGRPEAGERGANEEMGNKGDGDTEEDGDYLEEEFYPEEPIPGDEGDRLLLLTAFPDAQRTLTQWLQNPLRPVEVLTTIAQICQLFWYLHQNHWCVIDLDPDFLEINQPIRCFDFTSAYPEGTLLPSGLIGTYCAPELASNPTPDEKTSTYTIGALLYHALYGQSPQSDRGLPLELSLLPYFCQLLSLSLSPVSEERFSLAQLRSLLIETRNYLTIDRVSWEIASESTVGLSPRRLHNEDSYGIAQIEQGASEIMLLAALADGMGGMAQGEVASRLAVKTVLDGLFGEQWNTPDTGTDRVAKHSQWLVSLVERANAAVSEAVHNGGTTLSVVLAASRKLSIAHVGDSRIYLVRDGEISQLSEDHSLVALLVASGQISAEESKQHPDRNVLTKSLGSKKHLSPGYVQTVADIELQDGDLLVLCSDGVWDLLSDRELLELFQPSIALQTAVHKGIQLVLKLGAPDNATILALRCRVSPVEVWLPEN